MPILNKQGNVSYLLEILRDITLRKQAEEKLHESEERYREMFENTFEGVAIYQATDNASDFKKKLIIRYNVSSENQQLELLRIGRVDAAIINKHVYFWILKEKPQLQGEFRLSQKPVGNAAYRFMFCSKRNWKSFIQKFNSKLSSLKETGLLKSILNKYQLNFDSSKGISH